MLPDLYNSLSQSIGKDKATGLLIDSISYVFADNHLLRDAGINSGDMLKELFSSMIISDIIFSSQGNLSNNSTQSVISSAFAYARDNKIDLMKDPGFSNWINNNCTLLGYQIQAGKYRTYWEQPGPNYIGVIEAGFISKKVTPAEVWNERIRSGSKKSYISNYDAEIIMSIVARDPDFVLKQVEDQDFASRFSYPYRSKIYQALASCGKLTKKAARKIRSDSSEEASQAGIKAIAENLSKFDLPTEILSQVMDTKHYHAARYLAVNIPYEYLPFMAVCQDQSIRNIVVERISKGKNCE